ncbi:hypothetical protein RUND412_003915 [Rhizina undulata]
MDTIPTEILHEILSYVPQRDLGSVRLVNHFFNNAANDRYFRTVLVPFTEAAIDHLVYLSRPHVARCVHHIIYPYRLESSSLPSGRAAHKQRKSKKAVPQAVKVFNLVENTLSNMPNIREITTRLDGRKLKRGSEWPETAIIRDEHNFYGMESIDFDQQIWEKAFKQLLAGASQAQIRLDKLTIHSMWSGILTGKDNDIWKYTPLFQNLTSLTVFFCERIKFDINASRGKYTRERAIFKFLSSTPNLKKLSLGLDLTEPLHVGTGLSLAKVFGDDYVWKHLETFYFNGCAESWHGEELMYFWARHSTTLKTFGLYHPHLETGTWREIFDFIKEQPERCLENIIILEPSEIIGGGMRRIYRRGHYRKKINKYVLRGGPPFPPTRGELGEHGIGDFYDLEEDENNVDLDDYDDDIGKLFQFSDDGYELGDYEYEFEDIGYEVEHEEYETADYEYDSLY